MIKNGVIRKYVTERIQPFKWKVFGYSIVYSIIVGMISGTLGSLSGMIFKFLGVAIGSVLSNAIGQDIVEVFELFSSLLSSIVSLIISVFMFVLAIGYYREMLLCVNKNNVTSPVDFFKLGFKDWKRSAKAYLRILLKYIPSVVIMTIATILLIVGGVIANQGGTTEVIGIILVLASVLGFIISGIWSLAVMLIYQTLPYELVYDEESDAKSIIKKAKENLRGHIWQWTRMNYYYIFIISIITMIFVVLLTFGFGFTVYLAYNAGNGAAAIAYVFMILLFLLFIGICVAEVVVLQYFTAKNIYNLNELYQAILKEKSANLNPTPQF